MKICLENMAGAGTEFGKSFGELAMLMDMCESGRHLGVCMDTCHAFAAGYDVATKSGIDSGLMQEIESEADRICCAANDSVGPLGMKKDRHANIGNGMIGIEGFRNIVRKFEDYDLPFIVGRPARQP